MYAVRLSLYLYVWYIQNDADTQTKQNATMFNNVYIVF